ncbi:hypothetical protein J437_LFUL006830 [Ladona fulva]|uniref:Pacifastin domain-containing protein n=1 Tax=Ladona fulva TaxID=123851 RepID=A0A8K0KA43_LADFU|nr:hypothetical protein J437_LFUL006830 [Ladona fulva]
MKECNHCKCLDDGKAAACTLVACHEETLANTESYMSWLLERFSSAIKKVFGKHTTYKHHSPEKNHPRK